MLYKVIILKCFLYLEIIFASFLQTTAAWSLELLSKVYSLERGRVANNLGEKSACHFKRGLIGTYLLNNVIYFYTMKCFNWPFPHLKPLLQEKDVFSPI